MLNWLVKKVNQEMIDWYEKKLTAKTIKDLL